MTETASAAGGGIRGWARRAGTLSAFLVVAVIGGAANGPALMTSMAGALVSPIPLGLLRRRGRPDRLRLPVSG